MKISIVVPVYNAELYLEECISSVINQTDDRWELILVDDGSKDCSLEICEKYAKKYSKKIKAYHKENEGQFLTRQYGISKCSGEYIGFLDADDVLHKHYVRTLLEKVEQSGAVDVLCFGFYEWNDSITKQVSISDSYRVFNLDERILVYSKIVDGSLPGSMWSKIFERSILMVQNVDYEIVKNKRYAEDAFHSFAALFKANKIAFLDESLYYYRTNMQGFSQGFEKRDLDYFNTKYVFELIEANMRVQHIDEKAYRDLLYARNFNETVYYMLKFYRSTKDVKRKIEVIQYDWSQYLLNGLNVEDNPYVRQSYRHVWSAFMKKRYMEIFLRERFKKFIGW